MKIKKPFIFVFKLYIRFYLYDVNTRMIVGISKDLYELLKNLDEEDYIQIPNNLENEVNKLLKYDIFSETIYDYEIKYHQNEYIEDILKNSMKTITLQVTQNCNLRCKYCVYSGSYENRVHSNKRMSFETAQKAIDFLHKHSSLSAAISVGFYGGEPLLEMELMKKCVDYAKKIFDGKDLSFTITTNATLLTDEVMDFFVENDFYVTISFDGPQKIQDKNRVMADGKQGSFDVVMKNVEHFLQKYPEYTEHISFNAVLDPTNDFNCSNEFFMNYESLKKNNARGVLISTEGLKNDLKQDESFKMAYSYEMFKNFLWSCGKLDNVGSKLTIAYIEQVEQMVGKRTIGLEKNKKYSHPGGPCLIGVHKFFVNADGYFYPCERVDESIECTRIGNLDDGLDIEKIKMLLNIGKLTEDECKKCWAFQFCTQCLRSAVDGDHLSKSKRLSKCNGSRYTAEQSLKDYIALKECGSTFGKRIKGE